jgi:hypothetical protein
VYFLFHDGRAGFKEFALFVEFSHGGVYLDFPGEGRDQLYTKVLIWFILV